MIICPGIHSSELTQGLIAALPRRAKKDLVVFPTQKYLPYSGLDLVQFLRNNYGNPWDSEPLVLMAFSAGVVGAMTGAWLWQLQGGKVKGLIAVDGWGMPLAGSFPIYCLSHDYFTHCSWAMVGDNEQSFYAQPAVSHLDLWRSPQTAMGWWVKQPGCKVRCNGRDFLSMVCQKLI